MPDSLAVIAAKVHALSERVKDIEDVNPAVLAERVRNLSTDVKNLTRVGWLILLAILGALLGHTFAHIG